MGAAAGALAVGGGAASAYQQYQGGKAQAAYYSYLSGTADINKGLAGAEATAQKQQIGAQENQQQVELTNKISETVGREKTAMVSGVGGSSRSAQDIIGDTLDKGNLDELALRKNADSASKNADITAMSGAMNFAAQSSGYRIAGGNARAGANMGAAASLIGGASSAANSYYMGQMYAGRGYSGDTGGIGSVR